MPWVTQEVEMPVFRPAEEVRDTIAAEIDHGRANVMPFDILLHQWPFVTERPFPVG